MRVQSPSLAPERERKNMATMLKKIVARKCDRPVSHSGRRIIVMLEPGDTIAVREEGRRTVFRGSIEKIYWVLAKWHAIEEAKQKAILKKQRKSLRQNGLI
jgi:hypothetical protein